MSVVAYMAIRREDGKRYAISFSSLLPEVYTTAYLGRMSETWCDVEERG